MDKMKWLLYVKHIDLGTGSLFEQDFAMFWIIFIYSVSKTTEYITPKIDGIS